MELRGSAVTIPPAAELAKHGIELEIAPRMRTFELCRLLAATHRDAVLATREERRVSVPPDVPELLVLDAWHHPDVVRPSVRPSGSETFQQLARVLVTGDPNEYRPTVQPNTDWQNWPEGGLL